MPVPIANAQDPLSALPPLVPVVVGVTGHRDLREEDREMLETRLHGVFQEIRAQYPNSPFILLSPLAEGADRLAARVALQAGAHLIVPLPMAPALYEKDFASPASRAEFNELLRQAARSFVLPPVQETDESSCQEGAASRRVQYALLGAYLARHCQILIALWDGLPSDKVGGTGPVVRFKRTGRCPQDGVLETLLKRVPEPYGLPSSPLDQLETGPVYHVVTPRVRNPGPDKAGTWELLLPEGCEGPERRREYLAQLKEIRRRVHQFNQDALKTLPRVKRQRNNGNAPLLPEKEAQPLSAPLRALGDFYRTADALALRFQRKTLAALRAFFLLGFAAGSSLGIYVHLVDDPREHSLFLQIYLVIIALAGCWYLWARFVDYQNKHQDYRALAEGLRVQFFWRLAGLEHSASDHYLRTQKGELDWIRHAIQAWSLRASPEQPGRIGLLRDHWVACQHDYFRRASRRDQEHWVRLKQTGNGFLVFGLGLALFGVLRPYPMLAGWSMIALLVSVLPPLALDLIKQARRNRWPSVLKNVVYLSGGIALGLVLTLVVWGTPYLVSRHTWSGVLGLKPKAYWVGMTHPELNAEAYELLVVAIVLTAVLAALLHGYAEKRALSEHAKRYERMSVLFGNAERRLGELLDAGNEEGTRKLIEELGKEALAENGSWLLVHRERPVEVPRPF